MKRGLSLMILCAVTSLSAARGAITLPHIFSDHMVLQRDRPVPVWGKADPGEKVGISCNGQSAEVVTDNDGRWKVNLPAMKAGGPFALEIKGTNDLTLQDVYVGEVWLASGQSNMHFTVQKALNADQEIAAANFPTIRMFNAQPVVAKTPQDDVNGTWQVTTPQTVADFSAVGYFFARELQKNLQVPVGIINCAYDWTPGEAWVRKEALAAVPELNRDIVQRWDEIERTYPDAKKKYDNDMKTWLAEKTALESQGKKAPDQPKAPPDPMFAHRAGGLWNGAIAPLVSYGINGIIWWQGETNDQRGYQYRTLFPTLINDWRQAWGNPALPFFWVQLASVLPADPQPVESEWAEVREAQAMTLSLPHTGMAVGIDLGEPPSNVHPRNKQAFAHRLALIALAKVYGQDVDYSGPVYKEMKMEGSKVRLSFDSIDQGLATPDQGPLHGFDIAGSDHKFVHAQSQIDGTSVVVWSDDISAPAAVRYAWANNPAGANLNAKTRAGEFLPAPPFRTDQWPGKSVNTVKMPVDGF